MQSAETTKLFWPLLLLLVSAATEALYDEGDKVVILNSTTFHPTVKGSSNAWMVQFYNSWCGHCISFKPTWKQFAADVQAWRKAVTIGVVDCSITTNEPLCRDYGVHAFPTIKFFIPQSTKDDLGTRLSGSRTPESLRQQLIDTLTTLALNDSFSLISNFVPTKKENVVSLWLDDLSPYKSVLLIVEDNNSYTGREVMMDLVNDSSLKVVRMLPEKDLALNDLNVDNVPAVVLLEHNGSFHFMQSKFERNDILEFAHTQSGKLQRLTPTIHEELGNNDEGLGAGNNPNESDVQSAPEYESALDGVYLVDLENAVRYSLLQEVPRRKQLSVEEAEALRAFVNALVKYFSGRPQMITFLQNLLGWLDERIKGFHIGDYQKFLDLSQIAEHNATWMGCRGSQPNFRGYPCSMWLLFHTLTVGAYNDRSKESGKYDPSEVLIVMRDYVKHFFSCEECSQHFQAMAATLADDVREPSDGVLWLWQAHNKVNARLRGAASEDPKHPKVQFPSGDLCPFCQVNSDEGSQWDLPEILAFLTKRYSRGAVLGRTDDDELPNAGKVDGPPPPRGPASIAKPDVEPIDTVGTGTKGAMSRSFQSVNLQLSVVKVNDPVDSQRPFLSSWSFSTVDLSLCVVLYGCSALILLTVYFVIVVKRRLRKKTTGYKILGLA